MKLKLSLLTLMMAFVIQFSFAQEKTITGIISDENNLPLPGVNIVVKGTTNGTQTDFDGNYSISASQGSTLVFSYVGYQSQEHVVGSSNTISFSLVPGEALEEVIVVAYGTATKESFTGSVKTVEAEKLEAKSFSNVSQALAGEVSGVTVINTSGQPGTTSTIRIRGFGSVNGNRSPLYVVDGVPFSGSINSINPADIASTSILKDATATAIYGARGANGVILITTKQGSRFESSIEVDVKTGFNYQGIPRNEVIESPETYIGLSWEGLYNAGVINGNPDPVAYANSNLFGGAGISPIYNMWNVADGGELIDPATRQVRNGVTRRYNPEDWEDYGFQTSIRTEANLRMSGGSEKSKHYFSFGYLEDIGYIINSDYKRYSTRLNLVHDVKDWLQATANIGYAYSETNNNGQSADSGSIFWFVDNIPSIYPLYMKDPNGNNITDPIFGGSLYDYGSGDNTGDNIPDGPGRGFGALTNSIADAHYDQSLTKRHELNGNFGFNVDITQNLTFETTLGIQYFINRFTSVNNPFYGSAASTVPPGSVFKSDTETLVKNFLQLLRYKNTWGSHGLEVLAAHESNDWEQKNNTAGKFGIVDPNLDDFDNFALSTGPPGGYTRNVNLESYFGQINYDFDKKYFLSASVRRDGSSRFVNDKWGTFGSVGASWVLSNEDFLASSELIQFLKLKASYGLVGEQAGVGIYPGINTYGVDPTVPPFALPLGVNGNPDLTWETSKMFQTGVEFSLGNFVDGSIDYFIKNTDDLLFDRRVGPAEGIAIITVNDGQLRNSGLEFDLDFHLINKQDYKLDFSINGSFLDNEITTMPLDPATGLPKYIDTSISPFGMSEGHSIFDFYMREWAGVDPADGAAMWYVYYDDANNNGVFDTGEGFNDEETDNNGTGSIVEYEAENPDANIQRATTKNYAEATQKFVGKSAIPTVRGAFRLSAQVKKFDISAQFLYSLGGYSYDGAYANLMDTGGPVGGNNYHVDALDRWQQPGDITDVPRITDDIDINNRALSTRYLIKSDYLSLNNVRIGYTLDGALMPKAGLDMVNIWVSGDNLLLFTERDGFNPTTSETGGSSTYTYSPLSTITLGVRVKF